ncbi:glycosyltransferase family 1 protein [Amanita muscaria Koide BX008]|uniref:UDP-N-acetylglucosamine transferase subunit ALG13 n=1 Tax=Amanita muscaria (strain Koide BX008) TaxID=946122 RepID=A0A0C2XGL7_AMAMK|nr:glycosyltransferase family 1 protein [Amanita muscaria Koide BX008]
MIAFVTVGSTTFDPLVEAAVSDEFLEALLDKGFKRLIVQRGRSDLKLKGIPESGNSVTLHRRGIDIELWKYKPSLRTEMEMSNLVISHAGSGTIIEALRLHKPLIVVPNPTLLDDHQQELAQALDGLGYLKTSTASDLARTLSTFDTEKIVTFPPIDGSRFARLVDEEVGYQ